MKKAKNNRFIKPITLTNKNTLILLFSLFILFFFLYLNEKNKFPTQKNTGTKLGEYAPDFESEYLNGSRFALYDLRGTPVILNFWATWCPPCVREMPLLQKLYEENKNDIIVVGVNLGEDKKTIEEFIKRLNITFPIALDKEKKIESYYNLLLKPTTYFIDENGIIVDKKYGELSEEDLTERSNKLLR